MSGALVKRKNGRIEAAGPLDLHRYKHLAGMMPAYTKLLLDGLLNHVDNQTRRCRLSAAALAALSGMGRRTFFKHLTYLEDMGIVRVHRTHWQTSTYEIDVGALMRLAQSAPKPRYEPPPKRAPGDPIRRPMSLSERVQHLLGLAREAMTGAGVDPELDEERAARVAREVLGDELADLLGCTHRRLIRQWRQERPSLSAWREGWQKIKDALPRRRAHELVRVWSRTAWSWHVARSVEALKRGPAGQGILRFVADTTAPSRERLAAWREALVELAEELGDRRALNAWDAEHPGFAPA